MKMVGVAFVFGTLIIGPPLLLAAIINLEISSAAKFLYIVASIYIMSFFQLLNNIEKNTAKCAYWSRLNFIATHIRNENDDLEPAMSRLDDDLVREKYENETVLFANRVLFAVAIASSIILTPAILYHGVLGTVGQQTLRAIFD